MITRARPLLGTLVTVQLDSAMAATDPQALLQAADRALQVIARIGGAMSAHDPGSDLGRLARAHAGQVLTLDAHTVAVLRAAQRWQALSAGAFDPVRAAQVLVRQGRRPGLPGLSTAGSLADVQLLSATQVRMPGPVPLDLGGIAKGYAVDQAIEVLAREGVAHALVNAGGDMRVLGERGFGIDVRHAGRQLRDQPVPGLHRLRQAALATSVAEHADTGFVRTGGVRRQGWRSATVQAPDCMTADVLTKWALQSSLLCPALRAALRTHRARMWRS